jgi:hypothetical protein
MSSWIDSSDFRCDRQYRVYPSCRKPSFRQVTLGKELLRDYVAPTVGRTGPIHMRQPGYETAAIFSMEQNALLLPA